MSVTQGHASDQLTLRNTTLMPNIHGLLSLVSIIFAPTSELRVNDDATKYVGAVCGLGYDPETGDNYYPENDMEVTFDTVFDLEDLEKVNQIRILMNNIVSNHFGSNGTTSEVKIVRAQRELRNLIMDVIGKKRQSQLPQNFDKKYTWGLLPAEEKYENPLSVFPLINGGNLNQKTFDLKALEKNLQELEEYSIGYKTIEESETNMMCELCQIELTDRHNVKMHLITALHKKNLHEFTLCR